MRKLIIIAAVATSAPIGPMASPAQAAPIAATPIFQPGTASGFISDVKFFRCAVGRHRGPLGYCRPDTARPLFIFRRPCAPGRHRNFFGRCVFNR